MSGENWTPGPWFVATGCSWRRILQERTDAPVIVPTKSRHDGHPDLEGGAANLQLAAAAPDLYKALKYSMCPDCGGDGAIVNGDDMQPCGWCEQRREAMAKARGEQT